MTMKKTLACNASRSLNIIVDKFLVGIICFAVLVYIYKFNERKRWNSSKFSVESLYPSSFYQSTTKSKYLHPSSDTMMREFASYDMIKHCQRVQRYTAEYHSAIAIHSPASYHFHQKTIDSPLLLYIVYHDPPSQLLAFQANAKFSNFTIPVYVRSTKFFESIAYRDIFPCRKHEWEDRTYVGIISYKVISSLGNDFHSYLKIANISHLIDTGFVNLDKKSANLFYYDVVPFPWPSIDSNWGRPELLLPHAISVHSKTFQVIWDATLSHLNVTIKQIRDQDNVRPFFRSSYLCKPKIMMQLMSFMNRAIISVSKSSELLKLYGMDSEYKVTPENIHVAQRIFHQNYYEFHPFVFERLPIFFVNHINCSIWFIEDAFQLEVHTNSNHYRFNTGDRVEAYWGGFWHTTTVNDTSLAAHGYFGLSDLDASRKLPGILIREIF